MRIFSEEGAESNQTINGLDSIYFICLVLLSISIPLPVKINSILLIITTGVAVASFIYHRKEGKKINYWFVGFIGLYLIHFVGFLNSQDIKPVNFDLEKKLPLLIIPIIFMIGPKQSQHKSNLILAAFIASTAIVCLLSFRNGFYIGYGSEDLYNNLLFIRHPYLGMYCVICVFFSFYLFTNAKGKISARIYVFISIFFIFYLFVLFAKMAMVTFAVMLFLYGGWKLIDEKKYKLSMSIAFTLLLLSIYLIFINEKGADIFRRFLSLSDFDWENYDPAIVNSLNLRFIKWRCSVNVLFENGNWFIGSGTGDTTNLLVDCFSNFLGKDSFFVKDRYNSHNAFLTIWLHLGLLPLLYFIFHFTSVIRMYFINKNWIAITFTLCVILCGLTESIFEVQKGVVFYVFFQSLFLQRYTG